MKKLVFIFALLCMFLTNSAAKADVLNVPFHSQQTQVWCWLAAVQMVADFYNLEYEQCELATEALGTECCNANNGLVCTQASGPYDNITRLMSKIGLHGKRYPRALTPNEIVIAIKNGSPVIAGTLNPYTSTGHVVVIKGFRITNNYILFNVLDPNGGSVWVPYQSIMANGTGLWAVSWVDFYTDKSEESDD